MAYKISNTKEIREYIKEVEKQGWTVVKTNGDHLKWISPSGGFVISASTSSDRKRFFYNLNTGYASCIFWEHLTAESLTNAVNVAVNAPGQLIDNSLPMKSRNG